MLILQEPAKRYDVSSGSTRLTIVGWRRDNADELRPGPYMCLVEHPMTAIAPPT